MLLLACLFIWSSVYAQGTEGRGHLIFAVLDIGQGDALYIEGPTGIQVMVDAGPSTGAVLAQLANVMPLGDRTLDAVIETHPDADHMGGVIDILERYQVGALIEPGVNKTNTTIEALKKEIAEQKIPVYMARRGMVLDLGGGAHLDVLYPDIDVSTLPASRSNEGGIVARLVYGDAEALLAADISDKIETHLLKNKAELTSDVLKVGHHGSKTSTSDAFVAAVHPSLALISVGAKNSYGHPTEEVLGRLKSAGVPVMRTDQKGTVTCTSDGASFECKSER